MTEQEPEAVIESAAKEALRARQRIEQAVNNGRLPAWVLDACESWEHAALAYGAAMERRDSRRILPGTGHSRSLH